MDTVTHIVLGACTGELLAGKQLGKKALLVGAFANSIPDLDFVTSFWMPTDQSLLAHRGFTHSFVFLLVTSFAFALAFRKWAKKKPLTFKFWFAFFAIEIFLHLFIDVFNAYGTGLFEPFSHYRVSFNTIFVADPFYSIWLIMAAAVLVFLRRENSKRIFWAKMGLGISSLYFIYCLFNKVKIDSDIRQALRNQQVKYQDYFTTPTPLNNWLWWVVAKDSSGFYAGHYSVFNNDKKIDLHYFPQNKSLLTPFSKFQETKHLVRFSKDYYTVEQWDGKTVFNDLRFGQVVGWYDPRSKFVFHYFLQQRKDNKLVVQRGRFEGWNATTIRSLIRKIEGN